MRSDKPQAHLTKHPVDPKRLGVVMNFLIIFSARVRLPFSVGH